MASHPDNRRRLATYLPGYFHSLRNDRHFSPNTIASYKAAWTLLERYGIEFKAMPKLEDWRLGQISRELILEFLQFIEQHRNCSVSTRNTRLAAFQSFFQYLRGVEPVLGNDCARIISIPHKRDSRPIVGYLETQELHAVLRAVDLSKPHGLRDLALLCLAYNVAARVSEMANLRWTSLQLDDDNPRVRVVGKRNKLRELPLFKGSVCVMKAYRKALSRQALGPAVACYVFVGQKRRPMTRFGVADIIQRAFARAVPECPSLRTKSLTPHSIRHTTAVHLLQGGADLVAIQKWLGHESLETVRSYLNLDLKSKRDVMERCLTLDYVVSLLDQTEDAKPDNQDPANWLDSL